MNNIPNSSEAEAALEYFKELEGRKRTPIEDEQTRLANEVLKKLS